jgi:hypothetical protein
MKVAKQPPLFLPRLSLQWHQQTNLAMNAFLQSNWFDLVQTVFIVGGFWIATVSLRSETQGRKIGNLLEIVKGHREVWMAIVEKPELARVFDKVVDLKAKPITPEEDRIVRLSIIHIFSAYESSKHALRGYLPGIGSDVADYLSRPIPNKVWRDVKGLQSKDFVEFVDRQLGEIS